METKLKILSKLMKIMGELSYLEKDKYNAFHKYRYTSDELVKEKLHALLVENNVFFQLEATNARVDGGLTLVDVRYRFIDVDTGEFVEGEFQGSGEDKGDKGLYKAFTGATKYIMFTNFVIPTGDDPELAGGKGKKQVAEAPANGEDLEATKEEIRARLKPLSIKTKAQLKKLFKDLGVNWESLDGHTESEYRTFLAKLIQFVNTQKDNG